ncbi:hypothetical protein Aph01nite_68350 [Acrocarpospora phusangensis]|uniref:Uncharacterized protein n=1 Tax=Acrocarpospora phusangensis TaxID=1070424 RepID=A0A919QLK7_9ACTN|nr:hypothetical protein [Acrocarpospora phusangensis]GIH28525.1 hypothetical protein Aph01nite_68350 [Acrocarpospora phusangensis]
MAQIRIEIGDPTVSPVRFDEDARLLRDDLDRLGVQPASPAVSPPASAKSGTATLTAVIVAVVASPVLTETVKLIQSWVSSSAGRTARLEHPQRGTIELSGMSRAEQRRLVDAWLADEPGAES